MDFPDSLSLFPCVAINKPITKIINNHLIILSCHQHGYPGPSFATPPYRSSFQGYTPYPHRAAVYRFEQVARQDFRTTSCVRTVLFLVGSCWSANIGTTRYRGAWENVFLEYVLACPAVSHMSCSFLVLEMEGKWLYSSCFVGCCFVDLLDIARSILV